MTTRRKKKVTKQRGSKTHGWGSKKKHRGAGSRGGRGRAGLMKHKKSWMVSNDPKHFGRAGFTIPEHTRVKAINLRDVAIISQRLGLKEFDASLYGFEKILSNGNLSLNGLLIKAKKFSAKIKEKIEKLGGKVVEG